MPTARSLEPTARATFPTRSAIRRRPISRPATPGSRSGRRSMPRSASASVGTSGSRKPPAAWRFKGAEVLLYPTAIGSEPGQHEDRFRPPLAERHVRPCGGERHAGGRLQPDRPGRDPARPGHGARVLRLLLHRRPDRRQGRGGEPDRRDRARAHVRSGSGAAPPRNVGRLQGPPAGPLRRIGHARRARRTRGSVALC